MRIFVHGGTFEYTEEFEEYIGSESTTKMATYAVWILRNGGTMEYDEEFQEYFGGKVRNDGDVS